MSVNQDFFEDISDTRWAAASVQSLQDSFSVEGSEVSCQQTSECQAVNCLNGSTANCISYTHHGFQDRKNQSQDLQKLHNVHSSADNNECSQRKINQEDLPEVSIFEQMIDELVKEQVESSSVVQVHQQFVQVNKICIESSNSDIFDREDSQDSSKFEVNCNSRDNFDCGRFLNLNENSPSSHSKLHLHSAQQVQKAKSKKEKKQQIDNQRKNYIKQQSQNDQISETDEDIFQQSQEQTKGTLPNGCMRTTKAIYKPALVNPLGDLSSSEAKNMPKTIGVHLLRILKARYPEHIKLQQVTKLNKIADFRNLFAMDTELQTSAIQFLASSQFMRLIANNRKMTRKRMIIKYLPQFIAGAIMPQNFNRLKDVKKPVVYYQARN